MTLVMIAMVVTLYMAGSHAGRYIMEPGHSMVERCRRLVYVGLTVCSFVALAALIMEPVPQ